MNSTATHNYLIVEIDSHSQVQQPNMTTKGDFYQIYSPKKFRLRPTDDIYLDLKTMKTMTEYQTKQKMTLFNYTY